jgi:glycosyltransferase involved in cell wall biosynthesis
MKHTHPFYSCSVIVPARDEEGTISRLIQKLPPLGRYTEVIFVEGHSSDNTWDEIVKLKTNNPKIKDAFRIQAYRQKGRGKADAVNLGFSKATGDILIILDADLSVPPEDLLRFYRLLSKGEAQFVNGSRFVYPKEKGAMRYMNHLGNKSFAVIFSLILRQRITDTLCGTKALFRKDWKRIVAVTKKFSQHDPYGDFQLLLGAGLLGLKVKEVPVNYKARIYGRSKINPFLDGIQLAMLLLTSIRDFVAVTLKYQDGYR